MATSRIRILATAGAAAGLLLVPAFGQRGGAGPQAPPPSSNPGGGGNTGRGGGNTPTSPDIGNQPNIGPGTQPTQPIYINGRVMMDDGSQLPSNLAIERWCGGNPHIEGHTDSKGYFSIQLGTPNPDVLQDASDGGFGGFGPPGAAPPRSGISQRNLSHCELRVRAPGFQSQSVLLYDRQELDNPDIGTILLHRIAPTEGTTVSATTLQAPKNARKALQKGVDLAKKKKLDQAQASLQQAVEIDPKFAEAWFELGRVQEAQGQAEPARKSFDQSIGADAKFVPPYVEISLLEMQAQRWQELADVTDKALKLDSFSYPQAFFMNAVANYNLHRVDLAEQSARRAQKLDTHHQIPKIEHLLGVILADRHDYTGAAALMRDYLKFAPQAPDAPAVRSQVEIWERQSATASQPQP